MESRIQSDKLTIQTSVKTKESKIKGTTTGLGKTFEIDTPLCSPAKRLSVFDSCWIIGDQRATQSHQLGSY